MPNLCGDLANYKSEDYQENESLDLDSIQIDQSNYSGGLEDRKKN